MTNDIRKLLETLIQKKEISVFGKRKKVLGIARFATVNSPTDEYVKVSFADGSGMYFLLEEPLIYYFDQKIGRAEGITDEMIGKDREVMWQNKRFTVTNACDYQFVKEFYVGTVKELEGEVRFSDYEDSDGNTLSLGWNMYEGKRDDVLAKPITIDDISEIL